MKRRDYVLLIFLFFLFLIHPQITLKGAKNGLSLWYNHVLPALFPFALFSSILLETGTFQKISQSLSHILCSLFSVTPAASYAILVGYLCGYPLGAKTINDLVVHAYITKKEGQYLLSFCNNASPIFIISYVLVTFQSQKYVLLISFIILYSATFFISLVTRHISLSAYGNSDNVHLDKYLDTTFTTLHSISKKTEGESLFSYIDAGITTGFDIMVRVGGYIIVFSIVILLTEHYFGQSFLSFLSPFWELTNGIHIINNSTIPYSVKYISLLSLCSFGGICQIAQTAAMVRPSGLSIKVYTLEKLATALATSLLSYLFLHLF